MRKSKDKYQINGAELQNTDPMHTQAKRQAEATYDNLMTMNEKDSQYNQSNANLFKEDSYQLSLKPLNMKDRFKHGSKITKIEHSIDKNGELDAAKDT